MLRLLLFGVISQGPFYLAFGVPALNILFTLAVCLGAIYVHYHVPDSGKKNLMILGLFVTAGELKGGRYESKIFC